MLNERTYTKGEVDALLKAAAVNGAAARTKQIAEMFESTLDSYDAECAEAVRKLPYKLALSDFLTEQKVEAAAGAHENAAKLLDVEVASHRANNRPHEFCEDYGCFTLEEFAIAIRALPLSAPLAGYVAQQRLEEAKWWQHLAGEDCYDAKTHGEPCIYCDRIVTLTQQAERGKS